MKMIGLGSQYAFVNKDSNGDVLDGGKEYRLRIPAEVPLKDFWSIVVYDPQTRSELQTSQPFPSKNNLRDRSSPTPTDPSICTSDRPAPTTSTPPSGLRPSRAKAGSPSSGSTAPRPLVRQGLAARRDRASRYLTSRPQQNARMSSACKAGRITAWAGIRPRDLCRVLDSSVSAGA